MIVQCGGKSHLMSLEHWSKGYVAWPKTVQHIKYIEHLLQNCWACMAKMLSYQPLKHLLKNCCTLYPVLIRLVHRREWWDAWQNCNSFWIMPLTTLSDVLTIWVQDPECDIFTRCLICLITWQFCSTGLIGWYCNGFAVDAWEVDKLSIILSIYCKTVSLWSLYWFG